MNFRTLLLSTYLAMVSFNSMESNAAPEIPRASAQTLFNKRLLIAEKASVKNDSSAHSFSGNASWYGLPFHGRKTASGEIFDMNKLSAAHKTLPFTTKILVENPRNGQSAVMRVTDRGPHVRGRVLDLSREAARRVGIFPGVGYIEATVISAKVIPQDKK
jgi:rare lipoprotein A (peptidoglycan hydrolase)